MKILILPFLFLAFVTGAQADWRTDFDELLGKYVKRGGVDYKSWNANSADANKLKSVVDAIAAEKPSGSQDVKLAFYINAYNAWTLYYFVRDHPRQHSNALKRAAFFKSKNINVSGTKMSLESLENNIVRAQFNEPRIHFALNCASTSCPPLLNRVYLGETLNADLDTQTKDYLNNNPLGVKVSKDGKTAEISEIFKWFAEDFNNDPKSYINQYRETPFDASTQIAYQKYDWSRNDPR
ncbi:MAG: DUF547 domain-containing protein [Verrucomicrobiota bacterium]